ncbi:hypothetical protein FGIG_04618 [Fasciola gigantica]|uniref:Uncharacterized protein n=1 Tax=Fasciola gigantica TaxID=46835 RepID=A0A504YI13_FASGI|nr:hypothetical protein FGIG_04618 [Fasciola gigantica]
MRRYTGVRDRAAPSVRKCLPTLAGHCARQCHPPTAAKANRLTQDQEEFMLRTQPTLRDALKVATKSEALYAHNKPKICSVAQPLPPSHRRRPHYNRGR